MRWQVSHKGNEEIPEIVARTEILDYVEIVEEHPCQRGTLERKDWTKELERQRRWQITERMV